ncbi:MAG: polysaccharide biosynthesis C-terminal domain-containing protein, partial [Bacteroidetes bacterium]|nr:polysaccharide biosynthesis C-terminal domain-containing protein [Bacteroidota bacterium]
ATGVSVIFFAATQFFEEKSNAEGKVFTIRELVLLGYIAVPGMLITAANGVADKFLLSKFLSLEAVGLYSLGFLISVGVGRVLLSGILRANSIYFMRYLQRGDFMNASMILKRSEFLICGFSIVAFVGYYTFGEELVMIILGEKYVLAYPLMLSLFIAVMLEGMVFFLGQALIQKKKLYLLVINNFVVLCLAVSLNYLLIPVFGVSGPAIVLFVSYWVTLLVVFYQVKSIAEWVRFPRYIFATATFIFMYNQLY